MGMAGDNLKDYVYNPSEKTIVSYLRGLESHGRESIFLPSAIKWRQVYTSEVIEERDFKESWMEDFQVGAHGDRHAKWYATDLIYNSKGKGATRGTPRGGNWNLRTTSPFDEYNRKISTPLKEIEKNNCKVAFLKKQLQYRKGKEVTPWNMIEYTTKVQAQFAICQIFPAQPIEPSQDDVPLAAPAAEATSHAASVLSPGPHLQEAQHTAVAAQQTALENPVNYGVEGHQLQQRVSDLALHASSNPRKDMVDDEWTRYFSDLTSITDQLQLQQGLSTSAFWHFLSDNSSGPKEPTVQTGEKGENSEDPKEWPGEKENAILQILYEQVQKDPNRTSSFNQTNWQEIDEKLFEKTRERYGIEKIKEKYNYLRTKYCQISKQLEHIGVTCNLNSNTVSTAKVTWPTFVQMYKKLRQVFNHASTQLPSASHEEHDNEEESVSSSGHAPQSEQTCAGSSKEKRRADGYITNVKKKSKLETLASQSNAAAKKDLAQEKKYKGECNKATRTQSDPYSIDECMDALNKMEDVSSASYNKVLEKFKDSDWRTMFIKMPTTKRKFWLKSLE